MQDSENINQNKSGVLYCSGGLCKLRLISLHPEPTRLRRFVTSVPFSVRLLDLFVASLVFMKGTSCCVIRRNFKKI